MEHIVLFGAGGKMGSRCTDNLRKTSGYRVSYVEVSPQGIENLARRGLKPTPQGEALADADAVILAVPDRVMQAVSHAVVPALKRGAMVMVLDPAAPHGGELPDRRDIAYFITHPCHPPIINDETDPEARMDFYGGIKAKQHIVCALMQGEESDWDRGERIARVIFAPVMRAHRITVEQMALLEPAMAETVVLTLMFTMKEAMEEAVRMGVPEQAARDFLFGHMNVNMGILFGYLGTNFSDGALKAVERGKRRILKEDWKKVFRPGNLMSEIKAITKGA